MRDVSPEALNAPAQPDLQAFNLAAHVLAAGAAVPDKVALAILTLTRAERWSYARLIGAVRGCAAVLSASGLPPGARVAISIGNSSAFPVAWLGAVAAGLVPVALPEPDAALAELLPDLQLRALILAPGRDTPDGPLGQLPRIDADLPAWEAAEPGEWHLADASREAHVLIDLDAVSGPRAWSFSHASILAREGARSAWQGLRPEDRLLHTGPINCPHALGTALLDPWSLGATALVPGAAVGAAQLGLVIRRHDTTVLSSDPHGLRQLLRLDLPAFPRLRHALSRGPALPAGLRAAWSLRTGTDIHEALELPQAPAFISGNPQRPAPAGTCGWPHPGRRIAVVSDAGQPLPPGQIGRLALACETPGLARLDAPGLWHASDELVHQDHAGAVHRHGRCDEMLELAGVSVSSLEIEAVLAEIGPDQELALDLGVLGLEIAPGSQTLICLHDQPDLDIVRAEAFAAMHLERYKCPRSWIAVPAIPRGPTGRLDRKALAALARSHMP